MADLPMVMAAPASHVVLNVVEIDVEPPQSGRNRVAVVLMLRSMDVFGDLIDVIRLAVGLLKPRIVRVVVMKI